jgi:hypothetical protein
MYPFHPANSMIPLALPFCHGRGRGFEPQCPRHRFQKTYLGSVESDWGAKEPKNVPLLQHDFSAIHIAIYFY